MSKETPQHDGVNSAEVLIQEEIDNIFEVIRQLLSKKQKQIKSQADTFFNKNHETLVSSVQEQQRVIATFLNSTFGLQCEILTRDIRSLDLTLKRSFTIEDLKPNCNENCNSEKEKLKEDDSLKHTIPRLDVNFKADSLLTNKKREEELRNNLSELYKTMLRNLEENLSAKFEKLKKRNSLEKNRKNSPNVLSKQANMSPSTKVQLLLQLMLKDVEKHEANLLKFGQQSIEHFEKGCLILLFVFTFFFLFRYF